MGAYVTKPIQADDFRRAIEELAAEANPHLQSGPLNRAAK
jgi:hypothetical protein